ncbi:hypothetical protein [Erythrobacter crassostreae]|uniref:Uncharacterized protein n=1 Tax=Erythrobacter crassostreae TaxID=2828328 RepID=A0A9X1F3F5_9SPHN|nr:hypothetical protein [Erythrobacter crassostrea]MBV7258778.1 hypothetical protein [Erythrobacter crassostrea]
MSAFFRSLAAFVFALLLLGQPAQADSWLPPETRTTESANGAFRFTVEPTPIRSSLDYFSQELEAEQAGEEVDRPAPIGVLERRGDDGVWEPVWMRRLVNAVSPVTAIVADDGRFVVTFDNWYSTGFGENVIVIYGADGTLVRAMPLMALLPEDYIDALPRSVSSLSWKRDDRFDGSHLVVDIVIPGPDSREQNAASVPFRIALTDGSIAFPPEAQWQNALEKARAVNEARRRAKEARLAYLREPLTAPEGCEKRAWNAYLREAHLRLTPEDIYEASASVNIIDPPDHPRHEKAVGWLTEHLLDDFGTANELAAVSPCQNGVLAAAIEQAMQSAEPGSLPNTILYVASDRAEFERISDLLAPSGSKAVWLDPDGAIPQRPDRVPGSPEEQAAREEWERRILSDAQDILEEVDAAVN